MKHIFKHGFGASSIDEDGQTVFFTSAGNGFGMGTDGTTIAPTSSSSFIVTSPTGTSELFTKLPGSNSAIGSNGTQIIGLGTSGATVIEP